MLPSDWPQRLLAAEATAGGRIAQLCELCVDGLDCCAASVQLVGAAPHRFTVHATDLVAERLDDLQQELGEGPAVEVAHSAGRVVEADLGGTGTARWPWSAPSSPARCRSARRPSAYSSSIAGAPAHRGTTSWRRSPPWPTPRPWCCW